MFSIQTLLPLSPDLILPRIAAEAQRLGADAELSATRARVSAASGLLNAEAAGDGIRLRALSETIEGLAELRETVEAFLAADGQAQPTWSGDVFTPRKKLRLSLLQLESVRRISPSFRRLRVRGDLSAFAGGGLHFRLNLGPEGAGWPAPDATGELVWPGGIDAWHRPPYTIRAMDMAAGWLEIDIFLHEGGRITDWSAGLKPGDPVGITGPGGKKARQAGWMGLVGDETALPVILRGIEAADPGTRGEAVILVTDPADAQEVAGPPGLKLRWALRREGRGLLDLLRGLQIPDSDRSVFFAGERQEAAEARSIARRLGLSNAEFHGAAYWTAG